MILPTKHIPIRTSLLGSGARALAALTHPRTVSELWEELRGSPGFATFHRFCLVLDFLFLLRALDLQDGLLRRAR